MTLSQLDRYDGDRARPLGDRAVVVGGSMAGLCAARVLADSFEQVVVLERDRFPEGPAVRDGAPQTGQPHALLEAGRVVLEDLFPGFEADVRAAGGLRLDMVENIVWYDRGGAVAEPEAELPALYASRPLFEHVVRERIADRQDITVRDECHFVDYEYDQAAGRVTGVQYRETGGATETLDAALTVDATGRTSRTPQWLERHGYAAPTVDEVQIDVTYSTVRIERPADVHRGVLIAPEPERPRGAAMLPVEQNRWEVLLQGIHGERAPVDREAFHEWAETLPVDAIGEQLRQREWVSAPRRYPFPASIRKHYWDLDRFPSGLVVTGDAIASFNPVYGQGMSVASLDALALHHALADGTESLAPRFFTQVEGVVDEAWKTAVGSDFVFEQTTGPKPFGMDILNKYVDRLVTRAHTDGELTEAFLRVFRMERRATSLLRPSVLWRVFRPQRTE